MTTLLDRITSDQIGRFWSRVDAGGNDACWPWRGPHNAKGDGTLTVGAKRTRNEISTYVGRVAFVLATGRDIPPGRSIKRTCGTADCANPAHLVVTGRAAADLMVVERPKPKPKRLLDEAAARQRFAPAGHAEALAPAALRARFRHGETPRQIARALNVPLWRIGRILAGAASPAVCPGCGVASHDGLCACNAAAFALPALALLAASS
jgi:hypothetical protein